MNYLLTGITLGFAAGISPGPLMTLVITRTLERGLPAGLRVAVAPLLTDLPIVVISVLVFSALPPTFEIALTLGGALFILYLAWEIAQDARSARLTDAHTLQSASAPSDLWRGMVVNFLSPHPWLFWMGVAAPILSSAWQSDSWAAIGFLAGFYGLLIGTKVLAAVAMAGGRHLLNDSWYQRLLLASALLLLFFSLRLFWDAIGALMGYNSLP
jgi:threonine/homoserine/homoserine lactone efflux protein